MSFILVCIKILSLWQSVMANFMITNPVTFFGVREKNQGVLQLEGATDITLTKVMM